MNENDDLLTDVAQMSVLVVVERMLESGILDLDHLRNVFKSAITAYLKFSAPKLAEQRTN